MSKNLGEKMPIEKEKVTKFILFAKKMQKCLVVSKKSRTFAPANEK